MTRPPDAVAVLLCTTAASAILGAGILLSTLHVINFWELAGVVIGGSILVAAAVPRPKLTGPRNTFAHGSSRPASPAEAQAAARGEVARKPAHEQQFTD